MGRLFDEVSMTVLFPNNPVARESVTLYIEVMKSVCVRAAEGSDAVAPLSNGAHALVRLDQQG
jgi:2-O-sulfo trehalose long-chain-acyltransferase